MSLESKMCVKCLVDKALDQFGLCSPRGAGDGRRNVCKACQRVGLEAYRRAQNAAIIQRRAAWLASDGIQREGLAPVPASFARGLADVIDQIGRMQRKD